MSFVDLQRGCVDYPNEVSIETLALCNAACTFCPYPTLERKGVRMPDELLYRLVDELASWNRPVVLAPFKVNEPLLDKRLVGLLQRVNRDAPKVALRIFTNGSPLTPQYVEAFAGLRNVLHLWVSLNTHDPVEYEQLMALPFERTAKRLDELHASNFPHPVCVSKVGGPFEAFNAYVRDRWPKFLPQNLKRDAWIDYTNSDDKRVPNGPCARWFELSIMATGKVALCCMDGTGEYAIGDVNNQTMLEIYQQPEWRERRRRLLTRRTFGPCNRCTY